jgi:hypothetical protein
MHAVQYPESISIELSNNTNYMAAKKKTDDEVVDTDVHTDTPADAAQAAEEAPAAPVKTKAPAMTEVKVHYRDHEGKPAHRVFSKEVHGAEFAKLADEFKATNAAKLMSDDEVKAAEAAA